MQKTNLIAIATAVLCSISSIYAQNPPVKHKSSFITTSTFAGKVIPHSDTLSPLANSYVVGSRLTWLNQVNGDKLWHAFHGFPHAGISLIYIDLGDRKRLGYALGLQPLIEYTPISSKNFSVNIDLGFGLAYLTKKYSAINNPENVAVSTHLNYWGTLGISSGIKLTSKLKLQAGIETNHFSNGAIRKPNYGLNLWTFALGMHYCVSSEAKREDERDKNKKSSPTVPHLALSIGLGAKETGGAGGPVYFPITLSAHYVIPKKETYSITLGLDVFHDKSTRFHRELKHQVYTSPNDDWQIGAVGGTILPLDRLSFYALLGAYLYNPNPRLPGIYQKVGIRYLVAKCLHIQTELKTHLNTADHVEIGLVMAID